MTPAQIKAFWTPARMASALDIRTGKPVTPQGTPGSPHHSFNWYAAFRVGNIARSAVIFFCQPGPCTRTSPARACSGGVIGYDDPATAIPSTGDSGLEGPANVVWTAGRCLHMGDNSATGWSDDLLVCPAFNSANDTPIPPGNALGCWAYTSESTTPEWFTDNWESRDYGVIFLANNSATGGQPGATPTGGCGKIHDIAYAYIGGSTSAPNCNVRIKTFNFAYNQPRAQIWWAVNYHHPVIGLPAGGACTVPTGNKACALPRVTQAQYAYTHAALAPNPATGAADTGPGTNSIGAWQNAGTDAIVSGARQMGTGTGGVWVLGTTPQTFPTPPASGNGGGWQQNEVRFGVSRINSNTSFADAGEDDITAGQMQGPYFDTITCFDYQAWTGWPGTC